MDLKEKVRIQLDGVQKTLLFPLWARSKESRKKNPVIFDKKACEIVDQLDFDFSEIEANSNLFSYLLFIARARTFDAAIQDFIKRFRKAAIVNLGAGLDTTFSRVDNGQISWYDIDLPDVIELRRKIIPESERTKQIAGSVFDRRWFEKINRKYDRIFFIAGGLFIYFEESIIRDFLINLAEAFPDGEILFDASSALGNRFSNRSLKKNKFDGAALTLNVNNPRIFEKWSPKIKIKNYYGYFKNITKKFEWGIPIYLQAVMTDVLHIANFYHLKFKS